MAILCYQAARTSTDGNSVRPGPRERTPTAILCDQGHANEHRWQFCATDANPMDTDGSFMRQAPRRARAEDTPHPNRNQTATTKATIFRH
eukprot:2187148-Karenia_brevis.AAC.1